MSTPLPPPQTEKFSHSDECPCGTGLQTPNHILQSCPTFDASRCQTWPSPVDGHRKLSGPVETLPQTADFALLTRLKMAMNVEEEEESEVLTKSIKSVWRKRILPTHTLLHHTLLQQLRKVHVCNQFTHTQ